MPKKKQKKNKDAENLTKNIESTPNNEEYYFKVVGSIVIAAFVLSLIYYFSMV